jgi:hypothetical protein
MTYLPDEFVVYDLNSGRGVNRRKFARYGELSADRKAHAYYDLEHSGLVLEDALSGRELARIQPVEQWCRYAWAPDGQTLVTTTSRQQGDASSSDRHTFQFWERATGKECLTIRLGPSGADHGLQFSADGRLLAAFGAYGNAAGRLQVWDAATGKELWHCHGAGPATYEQVLSLAPDGKSLITGQDDSTILVWKLPDDLWQRHHPKRAARGEELEKWWAALSGADAPQAYEAVWKFVDAPEDALRFLGPRLKSAEPIPAQSLRRALENLDSNQFFARQAAEKQLTAWQEQAEPALRDALNDKPPLEKRRRIERLLATLPGAVASSELLRSLRAVRVLEYVAAAGSDVTGSANDAPRLAAILLLKKLAGGDPGARLTQEVTAALGRLKTHRDPCWTRSR